MNINQISPFFQNGIEWLGFEISGDGVGLSDGKARAIKNFPTPMTSRSRDCSSAS